jgi:endonuclease
MAIYDKPVRSLMKDMANAFALQPGDQFTKKQAIDWFAEHYPKIKTGTITAHLVRLSTNAPSRLHYSAKPNEDDLFFQLDGGHYRLYDPKQDPAPIHSASDKPNGKTPTEEDDSEPQGSAEFAYESDLRNYLAKNLSVIEPGLMLYEEEGINGIEFPVGGRFIDILAVDSGGAFVVIELKVSRGYDRVVGQLMRYMAWVRKNQAEPGQKVRGIIVARQISEDLLLACSLMADVQLFEYELSLAVKQVDTDSGK